jgi:plasmid stabilization system protein ParE
MVFRVEISPEALADLDAIARYIRERGSFESAERWFNGIVDSIRSLAELPNIAIQGYGDAARVCQLINENPNLKTSRKTECLESAEAAMHKKYQRSRLKSQSPVNASFRHHQAGS